MIRVEKYAAPVFFGVREGFLKLTGGLKMVISDQLKRGLRVEEQKISKIIEKADDLLYEKESAQGLKILLDIPQNVIEKSSPEIQYSYLEVLGEAYSENNRESEAIECFKKALEMDVEEKDEPFLYYNLGSCFSFVGNDNQAIYYLEKAAQLLEERDNYLLNTLTSLSACYTNLDQFEKAVQTDIKIIQKFYPSKNELERKGVYSAYSGLQTSYWQLNQDEKADMFFDKLVGAPGVEDYILAGGYGTRGHRYFEKEAYEKAVECYQKAFELSKRAANAKNVQHWQNWIKEAKAKLA